MTRETLELELLTLEKAVLKEMDEGSCYSHECPSYSKYKAAKQRLIDFVEEFGVN